MQITHAIFGLVLYARAMRKVGFTSCETVVQPSGCVALGSGALVIVLGHERSFEIATDASVSYVTEETTAPADIEMRKSTTRAGGPWVLMFREVRVR